MIIFKGFFKVCVNYGDNKIINFDGNWSFNFWGWFFIVLMIKFSKLWDYIGKG